MTKILIEDLEHILIHTESLWDEMNEKRIFITGGTGFFGCWLLESFTYIVDQLKLSAQAVILTRDLERFKQKCPHLFNHPALEFYQGDICNFPFPKGEFSYLIHAGTSTNARLYEDNHLGMFNEIIEGTRRTLEFAKVSGVKKYLLTSSGAVYGKQPDTMSHIPETYEGSPDTCNISSSYGEGKRVSELLCKLYSQEYGIETKIARCFTFVGAYLPLNLHFAIGNFIRDAIEGKNIEIKGDGTPLRSYLYASDLMIWLWTILFEGKSSFPYNVGSNQEISIKNLAELIGKIYEVKVNIHQISKLDQLPNRYVPSINRSLSLLEDQTMVELTEAIKKTFVWYGMQHRLRR
ncbi:epimerase [Nostoc sp. 'Peltigera membranacea cyanobiont' 213]|uniref:NAD-dependent epimerase/dehydratase family protein n=1 Tax=Nostoc sp. 'Peltigera membranacea cyanobiont' 213 TaxID=2014530 RepID=UPI000B959EAF|nr:NAD-dependent epimerase/dehydratase family protein [Nostoc sp. 'Peltigera membranacea cyanobiont' 213]OYD94323.1 epimerase [Nostoc sp. 'Peltigera membranacea cyanobiont' 213]